MTLNMKRPEGDLQQLGRRHWPGPAGLKRLGAAARGGGAFAVWGGGGVGLFLSLGGGAFYLLGGPFF